MLCVPLLLFCARIPAAAERNQWKQLGHGYDLAHLPFSLADAPFLSDAERAQIYAAVDDKSIHDSFLDNERVEERKTVLSSAVGLIALSDDAKPQIIVRGLASFCGASGNCSIWIFARDSGRLRLILQTGGNNFIVGKTSTRGFHDIATGWHMSAEEVGIAVYEWDGREYIEADCYSARFDLSREDRPPVLTTCPGRKRR